ncbi:MAG: PLP-dependent aminotransferase family protein [Ktedonobacteraceae bacterium]|nr:PLP-dependent aminotransferase family protein [Ktedonobacteraceae bacterium]
MEVQWEKKFAQRMQKMKSSTIRELLKVTEQPEMISFAGGLPAPEVFPIEHVDIATHKVLTEHGEQALQYGATEGYRPLRELLAQRLSHGKLQLTVDNVLIVSGSQQALDLLGKIIIDPGDRIVVEAPTYMGALQAWNAYEAAYITVAADEQGMQTDYLEEALLQNPKYVYVLPNFQNPTGVTLTEERRRVMVQQARRYGVPIVEDDPYGELRFEGEHLPSLLSLEGELQQGSYQGNGIYLGTFSKTMAPGMRLGWVIAPSQVIGKLVQAKQGVDLHTATFTQMIAYELLKDGFLDEHVHLIRRVYQERRDAMLAAMEEYFPEEVKWTHPEGGMFLWVTLPEGSDATELLKQALERNVVFVPGESFYPNGGGQNTMRLNYSHDESERIREGIGRLARVLRTSFVAR